MEQMNDTYYQIHISYEIPYNILDDTNPSVVKAREILYERLKTNIPEKYARVSVKLVLHQLKDTLNYLVTYSSFFRSPDGLPMEEYVNARQIKENVQKEIEDFFDSVDCEYRQVNLKIFI